ncbi:MAG: DNA-formamidopyrimidine glycosylase [Candidatus Omnitrophota bacterium]
MPELPEVETIKRELEKTLPGRKIIKVSIHHPAVVRGITPDKFRKGLEGATFQRILRKAKVLILELSNGKSLVIHLKMTGQLVYPGDGRKSRVSFLLSGGRVLDFNDQRLFAELRLLDDWRNLRFIQRLGPEPFDLTLNEFKGMLAGKKSKIKSLLMDQSFISGIGNLYAAEILFRARINPWRAGSSLSDKEKTSLFRNIKATLKEAIAHKGSSIDQYVRLSGGPGDYLRYHKVYGREGKPCFACGSIIQRSSLAGRGTYFCPLCQK